MSTRVLKHVANNARTTITEAINSSDSQIPIPPGDVSKFDPETTNSSGTWVTLHSGDPNDSNEIVLIDSVGSGVLNVASGGRGAQGSGAKQWPIGTICEILWTAGHAEQIPPYAAPDPGEGKGAGYLLRRLADGSGNVHLTPLASVSEKGAISSQETLAVYASPTEGANATLNIQPRDTGLGGIDMENENTGRWSLKFDTSTESGANSGSDLELISLNDAGNTFGAQHFVCSRAGGTTFKREFAAQSRVRFSGVVNDAIDDGAVAAPDAYLLVLDTEAEAATDDLETITGGEDGQVIVMSSANPERNVVVKNGAGNILCGSDITLQSGDIISLIYFSAINTWVRTASAINN